MQLDRAHPQVCSANVNGEINPLQATCQQLLHDLGVRRLEASQLRLQLGLGDFLTVHRGDHLAVAAEAMRMERSRRKGSRERLTGSLMRLSPVPMLTTSGSPPDRGGGDPRRDAALCIARGVSRQARLPLHPVAARRGAPGRRRAGS